MSPSPDLLSLNQFITPIRGGNPHFGVALPSVGRYGGGSNSIGIEHNEARTRSRPARAFVGDLSGGSPFRSFLLNPETPQRSSQKRTPSQGYARLGAFALPLRTLMRYSASGVGLGAGGSIPNVLAVIQVMEKLPIEAISATRLSNPIVFSAAA
jgi:hypothetical protein